MRRDFILSLCDIIENTDKAERFIGSLIDELRKAEQK
jgi:hypothetical protein